MRKFRFGSLSPQLCFLAAACVALLLTAGNVTAQSRNDADSEESDTNVRESAGASRRSSQNNQANSAQNSGQNSAQTRAARNRENSRNSQAGGQQNRPSLGVVFYNDASNPLEVRRVLANSAAESAGIERGDEIVSINGRRVASVDQLKRQLERAGTSAEVELGILRDGRQRTIEANLSSSRRGYASRGRSRQQAWNQEPYGRDESYGQWQDDDEDDYNQGYRTGGRASRGQYNAQSYGNQGYGNQGYGNRGYTNRGYGNQAYAGQNYGPRSGYGNQRFQQYGNLGSARGSRGGDDWMEEDEYDDRYSQGYRGSRGSNRAFLGVTLNDSMRDRVVVRGVYPNSPADEAGLRPGDEIMAVDDEDVRGERDLERILSQRDVDDDVEISVERNGRERTLQATLASEREVLASSNRGVYRTGRRNSYEEADGDESGYRDGYNGRNQRRQNQYEDNDDDYDQ